MTENNPAPTWQPPTPPPMLESEARTMAMLCHLLALFSSFVGPLVLWLIYRDRSALVRHHGQEQLNFQISLLIYALGGFLFGTITGGFGFIIVFPALMALSVYAIVIVILAAVAANNGEYYRIPLTMRIIS